MNISTEIDVELKAVSMAAAELAPNGGYVVLRKGEDIEIFIDENYTGPEVADIKQRAALLEKEVILETDKVKNREKIVATAGDTESLLGTTADATQLLLYTLTTLISKLHTANSLAEVREAAAPFAELSTNFLTKVEGGEVKLPFMSKGVESVVNDIEQRATAVAEVLQPITKGE